MKEYINPTEAEKQEIIDRSIAAWNARKVVAMDSAKETPAQEAVRIIDNHLQRLVQGKQQIKLQWMMTEH